MEATMMLGKASAHLRKTQGPLPAPWTRSSEAGGPLASTRARAISLTSRFPRRACGRPPEDPCERRPCRAQRARRASVTRRACAPARCRKCRRPRLCTVLKGYVRGPPRSPDRVPGTILATTARVRIRFGEAGWVQSWYVPTKAALFQARRRLGPEPLKALFGEVAR